MNKKEAVTQLEIMATNATGRLGEAKSEEEKALLNKQIEALNMGIDALKDYKPKTGHWIIDGCLEMCDQCGEPRDFPHWKYCPNCGAKMERSKG